VCTFAFFLFLKFLVAISQRLIQYEFKTKCKTQNRCITKYNCMKIVFQVDSSELLWLGCGLNCSLSVCVLEAQSSVWQCSGWGEGEAFNRWSLVQGSWIMVALHSDLIDVVLMKPLNSSHEKFVFKKKKSKTHYLLLSSFLFSKVISLLHIYPAHSQGQVFQS
jgi:hypothetical protein